MIKIKKTTVLLVVFLLVLSIAAAQFELEDVEEYDEEDFYEEEYVEEEILVEDRAGTTPDSPFYFVDEVMEDITLAMKKGEEKADYALQIAEEKVAEAKLMAEKNKSTETIEALEKAKNVSIIIEQEVSPGMENETNQRMEAINDILKEMEEQIPADWDEIKNLIDEQSSQAEKTRVAAELAGKIGNLCEKLAMQDWEAMQEEPRCDPDNAPGWLDEYIGDELRAREEESQEEIIEDMSQCITDPRECDCSKIPIKSHREMCEEAIPLAIECEFEFNQRACDELDAIEMPEIEEESFLEKLFEDTFTEKMAKKKEEMFDIFAPPECKEAGLTTREECEELMFEMYGPPPDECMEDGEFIGPAECEEIMEEIYGPTPDECLDDDGRFIGEMECMEIMLPQECKDAGAYSREECEAVMFNVFAPPECIEAGATTEEECEEIMFEIHGPPPEECMEGGEFIGEEECDAIMEELHGPPPEECMEDGEYVGEEECMAIIVPECIEAGGTTWDDCEEFFKDMGGEDSNRMPKECMDNGNYIGMHACEEAMWDMMGRPPEECFREGQYIGGDYCKQLTGVEYAGAPPDECVDGDIFIGQEECGDMMGWGEEPEGEGPPEECTDEIGWYIGDEECMKRTDPGCVSLGATNWDECHNLMREKYGASPPECFEGEGMGFVGELKCAVIIEEMYGGQGPGQGPPEYCFENEEYIGDDECSALHDEMGGYGEGPPQYCFDENEEYLGDDACSALHDEMGGPVPGGPMGEPGEGPADYCYEDGEYLGNEECTRRNNMRIIEEGEVADYCFDENYQYIGDDSCTALNDHYNQEQIEDLYDEIDNLEEDLVGGLEEEYEEWEEVREEEVVEEELVEETEEREQERSREETEEEERHRESEKQEPEEEEEKGQERSREETEEEERHRESEKQEPEEVKEEPVEESNEEITGAVVKVTNNPRWFSALFGE